MNKQTAQLSRNVSQAAAKLDHSLLSPWLGGKSFDEVYEQYDQQGYILFEDVMDSAEVQRVRDALAPF